MPHRLVSYGILLLWAVAAAALIARDVLPDLIVGPPPDLRDVAAADEAPGPTTWTLLVSEPDADDPDDLRAVGRAVTETVRQADGHVRFESDVTFDSGELLRATRLEPHGDEQLEVHSTIDVDAVGNLNSFRSGVRIAGEPTELLVIEGHLIDDAIAVTVRGPLMSFGEWTHEFPYEARGMVQNTLAPMERLPGLHVGQRWKSEVVSPLTGRVETVFVEVVDRNVMVPWGDRLVPTYLIKSSFSRFEARTWARASDGLVIRQEVPLMIVRLILERQPPEDGGRGAAR